MINRSDHGHFVEATSVLARFSGDTKNIAAVERAGEMMVSALKSECKIISCGNGWQYVRCDALRRGAHRPFREDRAPIAALSISDPGHLTCVGNDHGFEQVFARFVLAHGRTGDVLLAIVPAATVPMCCERGGRKGTWDEGDRPHWQ
jgi:D-sedoheptulose 7-phosphate isomerase